MWKIVQEQSAEENILTQQRGRRKLHSERFHDLYTSPDIVMLMKSKWMRWVEHATHMGECEMYVQFQTENLKESNLRGLQ